MAPVSELLGPRVHNQDRDSDMRKQQSHGEK